MKHGVLIFLLGAAVGAGGTWLFAKRYFSNLRDSEVASVKDAYRRREAAQGNADILAKGTDAHQSGDTDILAKGDEKPDVMDFYKDKINKQGYTSYSGEKQKEDPIRIISYDDFDIGDYEKLSYTYYSDGVLTDENDDRIMSADILETLLKGLKNGEEQVYIRNDILKLDYEIYICGEPFDGDEGG